MTALWAVWPDAESIARALPRHQRQGDGWIACCPAHDDKTPSLSIADGRNGRPVYFCHAGCDQGEVRVALQARGLLPERGAAARTAPRPKPRPAKPKRNDDPAGYARRIWAASEPIAGTVAEWYLRHHRGIAGPLPDSLAFNWAVKHGGAGRYFPALLVPALDAEGELCRVQAIFLDKVTGGKARLPDGCRGKLTFGAGASHRPAVFTGTPGGRFDAVLCEGPEDAIALRSVLEVGDVGATLGAGSLHKIRIFAGTRVCIVADNDAAGAKGAQKAAAEYVIRGCEVWIATPPDGCKDANDVLKAFGAAGVRAMLEAAERFQVAPPEAAAVATLSAAEAAMRSRQAVARFFERALASVPESLDFVLDLNLPPPALAMGIRGSVGLGKTQAVLEHLIRPEMAGKHINFYAPEHRLNGELLERFNALAGGDAPKARVVLGREQVRPDGVAMCLKADLAKSVTLLGQNVQTHLCAKEREVGEVDPETGERMTEIERCEHFETCPYQQQRADKAPGVRFLSHAHLFVRDAVSRADVNIVDESFWRAALRGVDRAYFLVPNDLRLPRRGIGDACNADLVAISERCVRAIYAGGRLEDFEAAGVTKEDAGWAKGIEYGRVEALNVTPAMPRTRQEDAIKRYRQQEALKFARFFGLLAECLDAGADPVCFELKEDEKAADGRIEDRLYMVWHEGVRAPDAPTLLLDANLEPEIARRFFPGLEAPIVAEARLSNYHATQITDHAVPKSRLVPPHNPDADPEETKRRANRRGELRRLVEVEAAKGETLCVTYRDARLAIEAEGEIPNARFAHWNALRGHDEWRDVETLIVAGVPQPSVQAVERMTRALCYLDAEPVAAIARDQQGRKSYRNELRLIALADGTTRPVRVDVHPDRRCTLLLDQIRAETMQAIGRARLVHRPADKPCKLIVLTNYPLPMPVHELGTWDGVMPDPLAVLEARGIVPETWRDVETVLKDMIEAEGGEPGDAARKAFRRARIPDKPLLEIHNRGLSGIRAFRCRMKGRRKGSRVLVDVSRHPEPREALEAMFGELEVFEPLEPDGAAAGEAKALPQVTNPEPSQPSAPEVQPQLTGERALYLFNVFRVVTPAPDPPADVDYEWLFIIGGTEAVLRAQWRLPQPP